MKEQLAALWAKVVENKELFIRVGCAAGGALVGAAITSVIQSQAHDLEVAYLQGQIDAPMQESMPITDAS